MPRPLGPQLKVVQQLPHPANAGYVEQMKLSQESIASNYGVSRDMLMSGSNHGNASSNHEATSTTLQKNVEGIAWLLGDILTSVFSFIYAEDRIASTLGAIAASGDVSSGSEDDSEEDVDSAVLVATSRRSASLQTAHMRRLENEHRRTHVEIFLIDPSVRVTPEELTRLWLLGCISDEDHAEQQLALAGLSRLSSFGKMPKKFFSDDERKMMALSAFGAKRKDGDKKKKLKT